VESGAALAVGVVEIEARGIAVAQRERRTHLAVRAAQHELLRLDDGLLRLDDLGAAENLAQMEAEPRVVRRDERGRGGDDRDDHEIEPDDELAQTAILALERHEPLERRPSLLARHGRSLARRRRRRPKREPGSAAALLAHRALVPEVDEVAVEVAQLRAEAPIPAGRRAFERTPARTRSRCVASTSSTWNVRTQLSARPARRPRHEEREARLVLERGRPAVRDLELDLQPEVPDVPVARRAPVAHDDREVIELRHAGAGLSTPRRRG
jgi:hypothetical protein